VQPKYKVVHTFGVDMMDAWEGHKGTVEEGVLQKKSVLPVELNVTIFATFAEGMRDAKLDINESTLVFEYPNLYYLDLDLKYRVNPQEGKAKFDKTKKTLTIRLPVVGSTEQSQKVLDRDYKDYLEREQQRQLDLKRLELSKLEEEALRKARGKENQSPNEADPDMEGASGISKKTFIQASDGSQAEQIDDLYTRQTKEQEADPAKARRENFLNIYKES
jgi:hypothetical protein